ncbi:MAG TPA: NAD-dependent epimerase/dehydratase family protein [Thermomicrobiales bacterium]|nr:NAD-dependent epimerase/dehydratase family protein [Thermomicrobiales bacterium]
MRALAAGGAGMIGSHLVDALLARGDEVVAVDNLLTGRQRNLAHLAGCPRFRLIVEDIRGDLAEIRAAGPFDRIYHLASPASPRDFARYPLETLTTNAEGTRRLLDIACDDGARLLFASTSEVYGDPETHPQPESYRGNVNPIGPRSPYDEGKRYGESLCIAACRSAGTDVRIARLFNTYGPRSRPDDGRVVPNFCRQALLGGSLTIYGDGSQTRSLAYVGDIVRGLIALMEAPRLVGEVVNLGCPEELTVRDLADRVLAISGRWLSVVSLPLPPDDPVRRCPDIAKARRLLGWSPRVGLDDGLRMTLAAMATEICPPRRSARTCAAVVAAAVDSGDDTARGTARGERR